MLGALPPGKGYDDKFVLGAYEDESLVGCVDLIRHYPSASFAYIGLLLIAQRLEGQGYAANVFGEVRKFIAKWQTCTVLRLGVLATNPRAMRFWLNLGFQPTGEVKPYMSDRVNTEVHLYELPLSARAKPST
jgi:RimJ/RimL family protein N-acetyltransferase